MSIRKLQDLLSDCKSLRTMVQHYCDAGLWSYSDMQEFARIKGLNFDPERMQFIYQKTILGGCVHQSWEPFKDPKANLKLAREMEIKLIDEVKKFKKHLSKTLKEKRSEVIAGLESTERSQTSEKTCSARGCEVKIPYKNQAYCSKECSARGRSKNQGLPDKKKCKYCGIDFPWPKTTRNGKRVRIEPCQWQKQEHCSTSCASFNRELFKKNLSKSPASS